MCRNPEAYWSRKWHIRENHIYYVVMLQLYEDLWPIITFAIVVILIVQLHSTPWLLYTLHKNVTKYTNYVALTVSKP
jgi:hypothetical protein